MPTRPFIPAPGVFKVQLIYLYNSQRIENVFNVRSGGALLVADADRIEAVFANWWNVSARAQVTSQCSLNLIVLDALDSASGLHKEYTSGWTPAGSGAGSAAPGNITSSVKLSTGLRGRSFRGRFYWPGLGTAFINGNQLNTGVATAIQTSANLLRTNLAAGSPSDRLVVTSYRTGGSWRTTAVSTEVTAASTHANVDSQRRRLSGRGL